MDGCVVHRFAKVMAGIDAGYIVCISTRNVDPSYEAVGLVAQHAYSVTKAVQVTAAPCCMRNQLSARNV